MPAIQHANRAISTLNGAITDSAVTADVQGGEGARFPSLAAGQYFYGMLVDLTKVSSTYAHWEIVKVTARATDQFTIVRDIDGTNLAFPDGSPIHLIWSSEAITDSITHPAYLEPDVISQATAPSLTNTSASVLLIAPTADQTVTLPTSNVLAGRMFFIANTGSSAKTVQVNASGGGAIVTLVDGESIFLIATQNAPTAAAHWAEIHNVFLSSRIDSAIINSATINTSTLDGSPEIGFAEQGSTPSTPSSGRSILYTKAIGATSALFHLDDAGLIGRADSGFEALSDAAKTLVVEDARYLTMTPTAARIVKLPTTKVRAGYTVTLANLASTAGLNITVQASDASLMWLVCPGNECTVMALQDTPVSNAHWRIVERGWPLHASAHATSSQDNVLENSSVLVILSLTDQDPAAMFDDANDRLVLPLPGLWRIFGSFVMSGSAASVNIALSVLGSIFFNGAQVRYHFTDFGTGTGVEKLISTSIIETIVDVTSPGTDYVDLRVNYSDTSGTNAGDLSVPILSASYIGPSI